MIEFEKDIISSLEVLNKGGIILYPTDTVWGIGCDATDPAAVEKIFQLKQRPGSKAMIILVADERDILKYTASPDMGVFDHLARINKPTTVIYDHAIGLADNLIAADGTIAIRICMDEFCRHLIKRFRKPIVSTSANFSGSPVPAHFLEIDPAIKKGVDYVVTHRQTDSAISNPSAIIKWKNGKAEVVRE
jgi:L-threonylcarbamoyladenylate synthase